MSPVNRDLRWLEVKDFSKGLWTADDAFLMPGDAFQVMEDAYPQPGGGLRAFFKPTELTQDGLDLGGDDLRPMWLETMEVHGEGRAYALALGLDDAVGMEIWLLKPGDTSWTHIDDLSDAARVQMTQYNLSDGTAYFIVGVSAGAGDAGIWTLDPVVGTWTHYSVGLDPVGQFQSRLISTSASAVFGGAIRNQLIFSDPGSVTFPGGNTIDFFGEMADDTTTISGHIQYFPTTLLIATAGAGWFVVQGDLTDPEVRQMGTEHYPAHYGRMARLDAGPVFFETYGGVWIAENMASNFRRLDEQLSIYEEPAAITAAGRGPLYKFGLQEGLLFAPGGRVQDQLSGAWFELSEGDASGTCTILHYQATPLDRTVLALQYQDPPWKILVYPTNKTESTRYETYRVKTAPLRGEDGRQVVIREVQLLLRSLNEDASVDVTVGGRTYTVEDLDGDGPRWVAIPMNARGNYLDVEIQPYSNVTDSEAPILEGFRIGLAPSGHQIR